MPTFPDCGVQPQFDTFRFYRW